VTGTYVSLKSIPGDAAKTTQTTKTPQKTTTTMETPNEGEEEVVAMIG